MILKKRRETEALTVYHHYWESYTKGDLETFASTLDEEFEMIGTSETEVCHSKTDGIEFLKAQLHEIVGKVEMRNRIIAAKPLDDMVLINETCDIYVLSEPEWTFYSKIRISTLLHETESGWKVIQQHGSLPDMRVQEGETLALEKITKENLELRDAIKRRTADLEIKNRELAIEAALEKVRAVAMGMKTSEDLLDVCRVISNQLQVFGVTKIRNVQIAIIDEKIGLYLCYQYFTPYDKTAVEKTEYHKSPVEHGMVKQMLASRDGYFIGSLSGRELEEFRSHKKEENHFPDPYLDNATELAYCFLSIGEGGLGLTLYQPMAENILTLFKRFHQVFSLAYQRFRDIQKAEAQAREAQIEVAVEKVRAQSMAMHHPDDLDKVNKEILTQLNWLQIQGLSGVTFYLVDQDGWVKAYDFSSPGNIGDQKSYTLQFDFKKYEMMGYPFKIFEQTDQNYLVADYPFEKLEKAVFEIEEINPEVATVVKEALAKGILTHQWSACTRITDGMLAIDLVNPPSEDTKTIVLKIAGAFNQAYQRFLDLQRAEAHAQESEIDLALERVRAQTMAMHSSEDVGKCVVKMFSELTALGVDEGTRFGIGILNPNNENNQLWTARKDGDEVNMHIGNIDMASHPLLKSARKAWKEQVPLHQYVLEGEDLLNYYQMLNQAPDYKIQIPLEHLPEIEIQHCFIFEHGFFYAFSPREFQPDLIQITKRFSSLFEQTYRRYLDLQKAEAQAKEAQIEAALEKVRSRSLAMHKSGELNELVMELFERLNDLQIPVSAVGISINIEDSKDLDNYTCGLVDSGIAINNYRLPYFDHRIANDFFEAREKQLDFFVGNYSKQEKDSFYEYVINHTALKNELTEDIKQFIFQSPSYSISVVTTKNTMITLNDFEGKSLSVDEIDILKRFAKVFEQTYTRFLDLQKAEAQAREAQIEAALERVRSRSMAMHKSDELLQAGEILFLEMQKLGIESLIAGYVLVDKEGKNGLNYTPHPGTKKIMSVPVIIPHNETSHMQQVVEHWKKGNPFFIVEMDEEETIEHQTFIAERSTNFPLTAAQLIAISPSKLFLHNFYFKQGYVLIVGGAKLSEEQTDIMLRFAKVFQQTYTRFLDLQKAETQAREAQIENALEKVRSRSLAMQSPDELIEVVQLLREEMGALGVEELETSSIYIHDDESGATQCWFTIKNSDNPGKAVTDQMTLNLQDTWVGRKMLDFYRSTSNQTSILMQGGQRIEWIRYCEEKTELFGTSNFYGETIPDRTYHLYKFSNGYIGAAAPGEISTESWEVLKRATAVFSFAYTRFRDLQMAEASARVAVRQASLDRVRAEISSMRHADDLDRITPLFFHELTTLGIPFIRCGVFIIQEKQEIVEAYLSSPDGNSLGVLRLPYQASELTYQTVVAWRKGVIYRQHWNKEDFIQWINQLMEQDQIQDSSTYQGTAAPPESLDLHFVPFAQGMLYVGSENPLDEKELELVQALAKAFSIAYARYEDFVKLEQAKVEVESAMNELKATQSQLVQQEKLASLGQLTAGIAHEIKNPLNFVNNFSEVSIELVDEAIEERSKGPEARNESLVDEILVDIKSNLKKVHEHGSRANGIVTSMLQHSRGGSGKFEPTDLNALVKEYVNLSFHGMRAGKNPIDVEIGFELDPEITDVPIIKEDFIRVVINLCNNAFDACAERSRSTMRGKKYEVQGTNYEVEEGNNVDYLPKLKVTTSLDKGQVRVAIQDNGPGIPDDIKDKILQPFFTTKKGTEGTGLGLSITHDIIKAHGGELEIETSINKGTTFIIKLSR
jgi:signal transduction histidine kinase